MLFGDVSGHKKKEDHETLVIFGDKRARRGAQYMFKNLQIYIKSKLKTVAHQKSQFYSQISTNYERSFFFWNLFRLKIMSAAEHKIEGYFSDMFKDEPKECGKEG